ncbi:MAG: PASTA domain-containing protein [Flammeovirgaceae bacterium]|nr:PASTA domain-containing protein [Flammeovirgaceae bacterium]
MGSLFINLLVTGLVIATISISYFYIYLPAITNHGETITVPDLHGMSVEELDDYLLQHDLRWAVDDSSYSEEYPPLAVLQQYPKANSRVKEKRVIYVSVNRVAPPTVPIPDLVDRSRINAEVVLKSNELRRGKIILISSPFLNLVKEMRYNGTEIEAGTRVPKGAVIDLVVGDGYGPRDFVVGSLIGDSYERALFKLKGWNLFLGNVEIPIDVDTTGIEIFVYKQRPLPGDSVRVGDPVNLWVANKGYQEKEEPEDIEIEEDENDH